MLAPDMSVISQFCYEGTYVSLDVNNEGLINSTYVLTFSLPDGGRIRYVLQRINTSVFKNPTALMSNIFGVTEHIRQKMESQGENADRGVLHFIPTKDGQYGYIDADGDFWRTYVYVEHVIAHNTIERPRQFQNAGKGFGHFQNLLADYPSDRLYETIPLFHDTVNRYDNLMRSVEKDTAKRAASVQAEIEFAKAHKSYCHIITDGLANGSIPLRVTHNDTKLNNVLMDEETDEAVCVIDLDTIMPGSALYDFGDSIRFGTNSGAEDEPDLTKVHFVPELFEAFTEGFLSEVAETFTQAELDNLANSAIIMTLECGMRFLTDYLDGDVYFHTSRPTHNLDRTRTQFRLVEEMEAMLPELNATVRRIAEKYRCADGRPCL